MAKHITDEEFVSEVIEKSKSVPVLVDFWAQWCMPCQMLGPVLEEVTKEMDGKVELVKVDVDKNTEQAGKLSVSGIPDVRLFKDGKEVAKFVGAMPKDYIIGFLENNL